MREVIERYQTDERSLQRSMTWGPSPERVSRLKSFTAGWLKALDGIEFDALDQTGKVDFVLLKTRIGREAKELEERSKTLRETSSIFPFAPEITGLAEAKRKMEPIDPKSTADRLFQLEKQVKAAQKGVVERQKGSEKIDKKLAIKGGFRGS